MGHTLSEWQAKVRALVRDASHTNAGTDLVESTGLRPAFAQYSVDRPATLVTETPGSGVQIFDLPAGWEAGFSDLARIEYPARQSPTVFLDRPCFSLIRSATDTTIEQVLLGEDIRPSAGEYVRFWFTAPWPYPTNATGDELVDRLNTIAFEAVSSLAASLVVSRLALRTASKGGADAEAEAAALRLSAQDLRATYLRFLGVDPDMPNKSESQPVSVTIPYLPDTFGIFHP